MATTAGGMQTNYANMDANMSTGMQAYHEESARRCPLNDACNCTCRCCGFCILICWLIFGLIGAITNFVAVGTGYDYAECPDNTLDYTGECCGFERASTLIVIPGSCDNYDTAVTISGVNSAR